MGQETSILLLVLLLCFGWVSSYPPAHNDEQMYKSLIQKKMDVQVCGQRLSSILSWVCGGNYNSLDSVNSQTVYPFRSKQEALQMVKSRRRKREGLADECCKKPCSYDELKTYCAPPPSTTQPQ